MWVHIYNGVLFSNKKDQNNAICSKMDGPRVCHTEWSQTQAYNITYLWNLKKKKGTNELIYKTEVESVCRKQTYDYRRGKVGREE